jgi:hypothetical protein
MPGAVKRFSFLPIAASVLSNSFASLSCDTALFLTSLRILAFELDLDTLAGCLCTAARNGFAARLADVRFADFLAGIKKH